jgi:two-component system, NarL family, response regulator DevR
MTASLDKGLGEVDDWGQMSLNDRLEEVHQGLIRLFIVDDYEIVREGFKCIFGGEPDVEVVGEAPSADDLLVQIGRTQPDVVLLVARPPGVSGPDVCRQITQCFREIQVLIVSTCTDDALVRDFIAAGARGYVVKDIDRFELRSAVRTVSRGEGVVSSAVAGKILDHLAGRAPSPNPELNEGQLRILKLISQGYSNREIGSQVHLSENTVKSHVQEIFRKLGVRTRVEAALRASRAGWLT